jgi:hypothetical protein
MILVVGAGSLLPTHVEFAEVGYKLTFPATVISAKPHLVSCEIARTLAQVYRVATREHWSLIEERFNAPLDRWERKYGASASDAARETKEKVVEARYLKLFEAHVAQIVRRWGIGEPGGPSTE